MSNKDVNRLRSRLAKGKHSIGTWMQIPSSIVANILSLQNFDWLVVDLEHGLFDLQTIGDLFRIIDSNQCIPFARLACSCSRSEISKTLDAGAKGLIFPRIESAEEAHLISSYSRLPPHGERGVSFCHSNNYGISFEAYISDGDHPFLVAMIESEKGLRNLSSLIKASVFDAFIIGPYDLSASLGITGQFSHSRFISAMESVFTLLSESKLPYGVHIVKPSSSELSKFLAEGCRFIPFGIDTTILSQTSDFL